MFGEVCTSHKIIEDSEVGWNGSCPTSRKSPSEKGRLSHHTTTPLCIYVREAHKIQTTSETALIKIKFYHGTGQTEATHGIFKNIIIILTLFPLIGTGLHKSYAELPLELWPPK